MMNTINMVCNPKVCGKAQKLKKKSLCFHHIDITLSIE